MILKLLLLIFIGSVPIAISSTWSREIVDTGCTEPGRMCRTCDQVSFCIEVTEGTWLQQDILTCEPGTTCLPSLKNCTTQSNPFCDIPTSDYTFVCRRPGVFPDPLNCYEYHVCMNKPGSREIDPDSILKKCTNGFYFDSLTSRCSLPVVNGTCPPVTATCSVIGQAGSLARNPSLYYVCLKSPDKIFPQIFLCPEGKIYNASVAKCVEKAQPPSAQGPDGKCKAKGYFYDPNNCHNYFECGAIGSTPVARVCASKLYFNSTLSTCVDFKCTDLHATKNCNGW